MALQSGEFHRLSSKMMLTTRGAYQRREGYLSDEDLLLGLDLLLLSCGHLLQLRESELHARVCHLQGGRDKGQRWRRRDRRGGGTGEVSWQVVFKKPKENHSIK